MNDTSVLSRPTKWSASISIPPQPILLKLAEIVQEHTDKRRRFGPKWKFRLAPDLVMQLQPKLPNPSKRYGRTYDNDLSFEGIAYQGDDVDVTTFSNPRGALFLGFVITPKIWEFRGSGIGPVPHPEMKTWRPEYPRPLTSEQRAEYIAEERERLAASLAARDVIFGPLRNRVLEAFEHGFFDHLRPGQLLGSHCMCCGKPLHDPVSRARKIGPECYGSS